ncbi:MAG: universal stress protein [Halobacteriales archaeon]|nr:universal stress protein [Halobacteriales archaeon]
MDIETVLAPVDGSDESLAAVEYGLAVADAYDAAIHALYVLGEEATAGLEAGELEDQEVAAASSAFIDKIRARAGDVPVEQSTTHGFSASRLSRHPGSVILDAAEEIDADFLVVPREPLVGDPTAVIEKATEYVIAYASEPVLSV